MIGCELNPRSQGRHPETGELRFYDIALIQNTIIETMEET
jgi:hypothetical protein